ncbi:hypothetical protein GF337_07575, partial [candidate division KSB1 bacterium]|nr:hypothetical protein [candidate division KSB1 bacterium]
MLNHSFYVLIFLLEISTTAFGSEIRLQSMGNPRIALPDSGNQINLHDFGRNFAWILEDQAANWTRLEGKAGHQTGSFRRTYDPKQVISLSGRYTVLQHIGESNIVYGAIEYADVSRKNVYSTSDRQPYSGHPFRVTDATTGNIHSYGPRLRLTYNNALFKHHLFWAGTFTYQVESGLKKAIVKPENIYRDVGLITAIAFKISRRFSIGFTIDYNDSQENIEYVSPYKIAPFFYDINLFVSEQSFLPLADNMGIIKNGQQFRYGLQTALCFAE